LSLAGHLNLSDNDVVKVAGNIFEALLGACDEALTAALQTGNLEALEAKSALRHVVLLEEIGSIKRNLELLSSKPRLSIQEVLAFEQQFRLLMAQRHSHITLPSLSSFKKYPIDDLYVANDFEPFLMKDAEQANRSITSDKFIRQIDRTVVLGDPGAGKSTLSQKICFDLATNKISGSVANRALTPFLVVLRDYGADKKINQHSILQFIEATVNAKYQIPPPQGAIEYLLLNGRALVIFDGLDELFESSYRREVSADVESFCTRYPFSSVLVTSRQVGYDQAPLDPKRFRAYRIREFKSDQVKDYVLKWFSIDEDLSAIERRETAEAFLRESRIVSDLRSNPLILSLMCNIYRGENYIPRNRPSVYEKCALMLFDRWDRSRRIDVPFSFEDQLSPVMKHIAYWIFSDQKLQAGVTESQLISKATEFLHGRSEEDIEVAGKTARDFIEFCRGRAWIFRDMGTTSDGEPLYQFTHGTFLEYFTAAQLVRTHATPELLGAALLPRIKRKEWDIVAQLAFQLQDNNLEGAGDSLFLQLLQESGKGVHERLALVGFLVRCLGFMVPRPKTTRETATAAIDVCVNSASLIFSVDKNQALRGDYEVQEIVSNLLTSAFGNRRTVADVVKGHLSAKIQSCGDDDAVGAFDVARNLTSSLERYNPPSYPLADEWERVAAAIISSSRDRIHTLALNNEYLSRAAFVTGIVTPAEIVKWHGLGSLFKDIGSLAFRTTYYPGVDLLFRGLAMVPNHDAVELLAEVGNVLSSVPTPWVSTRLLGQFNRLRFPQRYRSGKLRDSPDAVFGVFCCLAVLLESFQNRGALKRVLLFISKSKNLQIATVRELLLSRYGDQVQPNIEEGVRKFNFSPAQVQLILSWVRRSRNFLGRRVGRIPPHES
jgi:hypothetical protein